MNSSYLSWLFGLSSPLPYFLLMALFIYFASLLERHSLFFRSAIDRQVSSPSFHLPFEGLRGILALSVFFHHSVITYYYLRTGIWNVPPSRFYTLLGSAPVIMFFFLTGYLFWNKVKTSRIRLKPLPFYKRRFLRLFPIYWTAVAVILITVFVLTRGKLQVNASLLIKNILGWIAMGMPFGYFYDINGLRSTGNIIAGVMWSLRYELIFYLFFPLIQFLNTGKRFWAFIAGVWILYFALSHYTVMGKTPGELASYYQIVRFMAIGFGFGMITAELKSHPQMVQWLQGKTGRVLSVVALLLLFFTFRGVYKTQDSFLLFVPFTVIAFNESFGGLLIKRGLLQLGMISYSVYLFHGFVLFVITRLLNLYFPIGFLPAPVYWMLVGVIGLTAILFSSATYRYIESPFLS